MAIYYLMGQFAGNCNPVHDTPVAMIVIDGEMLDTAIVPHRQRSFCPSESAGKFRLCHVVAQVPKDWCAFRFG